MASYDEIRELRYAVVDGVVHSLTGKASDLDALLNAAQLLYLTVDSCGYVFVELQSLLKVVNSTLFKMDAELCVPDDVFDRIAKCIEAITMALSAAEVNVDNNVNNNVVSISCNAAEIAHTVGIQQANTRKNLVDSGCDLSNVVFLH